MSSSPQRNWQGVWPLAFVAAALSVSLPGGSASSPAAPSGPRPVAADSSKTSLATSDIRPAMEALAESLGVPWTVSPALKVALTRQQELEQPHLATRSAADDADLHRDVIAHVQALQRASDDDLLQTMVDATSGPAATASVDMLVATVPDYVDSQGGWMADYILYGLRAALERDGYSFERFRFPDWPTGAGPPDTRSAATTTRAHERQPGALVFRRRVCADTSHRLGRDTAQASCDPHSEYVLVLVALETATGGVHRDALAAAVGLVREWAHRMHRRPTLRILGPSFSGSLPSLLGVVKATWTAPYDSVLLATGSANADVNAELVTKLLPGASYMQAIHSAGVMSSAAEAFMHERGFAGGDLVLLVDSSPFGGEFQSRRQAAVAPEQASTRTYRFPMHISQLRNDARELASAPAVLSRAPAVSLDVKDPAPPLDQIPALRPGLTSPTVQVTLDSLLDALRREMVRAVAIVASDARDVLFLAREVRRASPNVQLVLFGAHALYLHPEYAPYMRGAVVVSSHPLTPWFDGTLDSGKAPFPSSEAEGAYNATYALLGGRRSAGSAVAPDADLASGPWITVVGSTNYWPLRLAGAADSKDSIRWRRMHLPVAGFAMLTLLSVGLVTYGHLSWRASARLKARHGRTHPRIAFVGVLAPASMRAEVRLLHTLGVVRVALVLAALALVVTALALQHVSARLDSASLHLPWLPVLASLGVLGSGLFLAVRCAPRPLPPLAGQIRLGPVAVVLGVSLGVVTVAAAALLARWAWTDLLAADPASRAFLAARMTAGGVVSPLFAVIALSVMLCVPVLWEVTRLITVGDGYCALASSHAFRYLMGDRGNCDRPGHAGRSAAMRLAATLDRPLRSLPTWRVVIALAVAVVLGGALLGRGFTIEGRAFAWFLWAASVAGLVRGFLLLLQASELWNRLRACLGVMLHAPVARALERVEEGHIAWDLSLLSARLPELAPLVRLTERLRIETGRLAGIDPLDGPCTSADEALVTGAMHVPHPDHRVRACFARLLCADTPGWFAIELRTNPRTLLLQSRSFDRFWETTAHLVGALEATRWASATGVASGGSERPTQFGRWQRDAELLVGTQLAFLLRDMVSRVISAVVTALTIVGLVTVAHLSYVFQGRSAFLIADTVILVLAAAVALRLLVDIERNRIISLLRNSTPGRVRFDRDFVRQVTTYVVLPVVVAVSAIFPELGFHVARMLGPLQGWMGQ